MRHRWSSTRDRPQWGNRRLRRPGSAATGSPPTPDAPLAQAGPTDPADRRRPVLHRAEGTTMSRTVSSTVVIGFDGSTESSHAAEWAAGEAMRRHARLHVLTAFRPYPAGLPGVPEAGEYHDQWPAVGR